MNILANTIILMAFFTILKKSRRPERRHKKTNRGTLSSLAIRMNSGIGSML